MKYHKRYLSCCLAVALSPALSFANETIDEADVERIVVTAEFRDDSLLDLSSSVSVLDKNVIERRGANHIEQLLNFAPNVNITAGASRGRFFQIRGIGERSQFIDPVNPSVGLVIDGIDFTGLGLAANTLDVQQVEVFRGPQGTLYGANALAGLINLKTNDPTDALYAKIGVELSEFGGQVIDGVVSGPIGEKIGYRVAVQTLKSDGFTENSFLNRDDTNNIDETTLRGKLKIAVNDDLTVNLTGLYLNADNGYDAFSLDNNRVTQSDQPGQDTQRSFAGAINTVWTGAEAFNLEATVSGATTDSLYSFDEDWSFIGAFSDDLFPFSSADSFDRERDNFTFDLRAISSEGHNIFAGKTTWVAGIYSRTETEDLFRIRSSDLAFDGAFSNDFDTSNTAIYGQLDTQLNERWNLITGLRVEYRDAEYTDSTGVDSSVSETLWGGKIVLEYRLADDTLVYGLLSRGFKAGGVNGQIISAAERNDFIPQSTFQFGTETLVNLELGVKGSWFNDKLQSQLSVFYQDRDDAQVSQSIFNSDDFSFDEFLDNAAATAMGLEFEAVYAVSDYFSIYTSLGLLDAEFDDFETFSHVDARTALAPINLEGRDIAQAPTYQFTVGTDVYLSDALTLNIEVEGKDEYFFSNGHNDRADAYELLNIRLTYQLDNWEFAIWGRNLTDQDVQTRGFFFSNEFGNNPSNGYAPEPYYQFGEPRIVGINVNYEF
ncbi:TonB-dependent receptor [Alteromonas sp. 5E99-2]|uniref:TonB-dependent receptor n=1 Tax=Alteromonas sp. 5E99-2 TaxID=2817683 RepID=UPI001A998A97|nr:TonB-dependent receptor [Alteromonas sp. 5E99-2]MBO1255166.1 TonB-dependent receptor [Alteromonas sp. 5E99-2]